MAVTNTTVRERQGPDRLYQLLCQHYMQPDINGLCLKQSSDMLMFLYLTKYMVPAAEKKTTKKKQQKTPHPNCLLEIISNAERSHRIVPVFTVPK